MLKKIFAKILYSNSTIKKAEKLNFLLINKKLSTDNFDSLINNGLKKEVISCWEFLFSKKFENKSLSEQQDTSFEDDETVENFAITNELCEFVKDLRKSNEKLQ